MKSSIFFFSVLLLNYGFLLCQSPYQLDWKKEVLLNTIGGTSLGIGLYLEDESTLFTPDELETLDIHDINAFDRIATGFSAIEAHEISNYFFYGSMGLPLILLADKKGRSDLGTIAALWGETLLLNGGITMLCKHSFRRPRPYVFDDDVILGRKLNPNARASFISGHTSLVAANSFFTATVFSEYYPESKWKKLIWATAITLPAVMGYLRVRAGRHYPTDTIGGYAVGALIGWGVPKLHRAKKLKANGLEVSTSMNGLYVRWVF